MKDILLLGAGQIGEAIAAFLSEADYRVTVGDNDPARLAALSGVTTQQLDVCNEAELVEAMRGQFAVLSAMPHEVTRHVARAAHAAGIHYLDLTEDVATTRLVKQLAEGSNSAFIPQCGLAPGFISIVAADLARRFDSLDTLRLRVGALPQYPSNALAYNLTWSTDGLINEYDQPCEAIVAGELREVPALENVEAFSLDGVAYEAFNTSGGLGTLAETLAGHVRELNYKTVRYPGHRDIVKMLIQDLRLGARRDLLKEIFEYALPSTGQDLVLIFVTATGMRGGRLVQETYASKIYAAVVGGKLRTAIQITTASGICAVLDLLAHGKIRDKGFVRQEEIGLDLFLANRFGKAYSVFDTSAPMGRAA